MNIVPSLGIISFHKSNDDVNNDNIINNNIITKFEGHQSIVVIKEQTKKYNKNFTSQNISTGKIASIIRKLYTKKALKFDDTSTKVIKVLGTFFAEFLSKNFSSCFVNKLFP